jgi:NADP-dependent 3-hydroxy acid dehydrogenase YdfG
MSLEGKLALVTGGGAGIGRAIAEALASDSADVVICGRRENIIIRSAREISDIYNANCLGIPCDIRDRVQVEQMISMATESGDATIDILVNNAGVAKFAPIREMSYEDWDDVIDTNLTGSFNVLKAALPSLKEGSFIFNIESMAAVSSIATGAAYNASKAGLHAFSEAVMLDLRKEGIRVCSVLSGSVNTRLAGPDGRTHESWKMEAEDIANVIIDLLSLPPRAMPSRIDIRPTKTQDLV